jgi:hypothetical protein
MQQWYYLNVVVKAPGTPYYAPTWTNLGWYYMNQAQLLILRESLSCCAETFAAYQIARADGTVVASMNCTGG